MTTWSGFRDVPTPANRSESRTNGKIRPRYWTISRSTVVSTAAASISSSRATEAIGRASRLPSPSPIRRNERWAASTGPTRV